MVTSIRQATRAALDRARQMLTASFDVAQVPEGHPSVENMHNAFSTLEDAFGSLDYSGRSASSLDHPGPAIRVIANRDMRRWPTTDSKTAIESAVPQGGRKASRIASSPQPLMTQRFAGRRMISTQEYLDELLEQAVPVETPLSTTASYSMIQLAQPVS